MSTLRLELTSECASVQADVFRMDETAGAFERVMQIHAPLCLHLAAYSSSFSVKVRSSSRSSAELMPASSGGWVSFFWSRCCIISLRLSTADLSSLVCIKEIGH